MLWNSSPPSCITQGEELFKVIKKAVLIPVSALPNLRSFLARPLALKGGGAGLTKPHFLVQHKSTNTKVKPLLRLLYQLRALPIYHLKRCQSLWQMDAITLKCRSMWYTCIPRWGKKLSRAFLNSRFTFCRPLSIPHGSRTLCHMRHGTMADQTIMTSGHLLQRSRRPELAYSTRAISLIRPNSFSS